MLSRPADAEFPDLRVWPSADVLAIFRFYAADEVDFDVDLRELQGQERLDVFCGFLREIGRRLGKPVLMDPEGKGVVAEHREEEEGPFELLVSSPGRLFAADGGARTPGRRGETRIGGEVPISA